MLCRRFYLSRMSLFIGFLQSMLRQRILNASEIRAVCEEVLLEDILRAASWHILVLLTERMAAYPSTRLIISSKTGMCLSGRYEQNLTGSTASGGFTPLTSISPRANISTTTATGIAV